MQNIYELPQELNHLEKFEQIAHGKNIQIERIISTGQTTPSGQWYDQEFDEWVILLQGEAELSYDDDTGLKLKAGEIICSFLCIQSIVLNIPVSNHPIFG